MAKEPESPLGELLTRFAGGETDAFDAVCRELAGPVRDAVLRILRDPAQAAEVCQETMIQLWLHADRFDPGRGTALSWSLAIARNLAVDRVRSERSATERQKLFAARSETRPYDQVVEIVEQRLDHTAVRACLDELSAAQREAVVLVYFGGLTAGQAAERLGVPPATVRSRLRDARARMRYFLSED